MKVTANMSHKTGTSLYKLRFDKIRNDLIEDILLIPSMKSFEYTENNLTFAFPKKIFVQMLTLHEETTHTLYNDRV